jgi:hypothetical protein
MNNNLTKQAQRELKLYHSHFYKFHRDLPEYVQEGYSLPNFGESNCQLFGEPGSRLRKRAKTFVYNRQNYFNNRKTPSGKRGYDEHDTPLSENNAPTAAQFLHRFLQHYKMSSSDSDPSLDLNKGDDELLNEFEQTALPPKRKTPVPMQARQHPAVPPAATSKAPPTPPNVGLTTVPLLLLVRPLMKMTLTTCLKSWMGLL